MAKTTGDGDSKTVSFRLDSDLLATLEVRAAKHQLSRGKLARTMVVSALHDEAHLQLMEELSRLQGELADLRSDIATTLELVLINLAGKDVAKVREFVRENLRSRR